MAHARLFYNKNSTSSSSKATKPYQSQLDSKKNADFLNADFLTLFNCVSNIMDLKPGTLSDCTTEFNNYVAPRLGRGRSRS